MTFWGTKLSLGDRLWSKKVRTTVSEMMGKLFCHLGAPLATQEWTPMAIDVGTIDQVITKSGKTCGLRTTLFKNGIDDCEIKHKTS